MVVGTGEGGMEGGGWAGKKPTGQKTNISELCKIDSALLCRVTCCAYLSLTTI